jgi:Ser-tRNA(Ala) deacylase AlaX
MLPSNRLARTTRVVIVHELGCPCGGTHVADIAEIGNIVISKIKVKKGNTQICYRLP